MKATAIANSNIAFVKYWGKKDEFRNIPMNPSISMTLDENISTKTTVEFSEKYDEDILILNNGKYTDNKLIRVSNFLDKIRKRANLIYHAKVVSVNSFPTGCGIASSASGFAALAAASTKALGIDIDEIELSMFARFGSGSATRSIHGGFVIWEDESAFQLKNEHHWPQLRDILVITDENEKKVSSRDAMRNTVNTSQKYKQRLDEIDQRVMNVKRFIIEKNFTELAKEIMADSDSMHDCLTDTIPKVEYLTKNSYKIKDIIKELNKDEIKAAYTFDAGPNAHIITIEEYLPEVKRELLKMFGTRIIVSKIGGPIKYTEEHLI